VSLAYTLLLLAVLAIGVLAFLRWREAQPEFAPLQTKPDDPLMLEAMKLARERLPQFQDLLSRPYKSALVKLNFVSSTNQVEHLWAEVLEKLESGELGVRLVTPPVTHEGELERLQRCSFDDFEDWQVRAADGKLYGGFTQRAMFAIARREGIELPKKLLEQERQYSDA
jgi:uncharacterized protein YegJ (DUF2314 family)